MHQQKIYIKLQRKIKIVLRVYILKQAIKSIAVKILKNIELPTEDFEVVFPNNAIFGVTEGSSKTVANGYYVITEPLEKCNYTILYKSSLICSETDCIESNFAQDIKYNLIVE